MVRAQPVDLYVDADEKSGQIKGLVIDSLRAATSTGKNKGLMDSREAKPRGCVYDTAVVFRSPAPEGFQL